MEERDAMPTKKAIVKALMDRHGRTFSRELGVDLGKNTPSPLFRWLCFSMLASARINSDIAMAAAKALAQAGWTTADKMADSTWRERTDTLNHAGYARYDESTSRMLGDTVAMLLDEYGGDLRQLRERAARDPKQERKLLKQCKGVGDTGASIFMREVQASWAELYPFADKMALKAAGRLDLGDDARALARRVERKEYPRFVAALIRTALARDYDDVIADASRS
jgi:endonuclease III